MCLRQFAGVISVALALSVLNSPSFAQAPAPKPFNAPTTNPTLIKPQAPTAPTSGTVTAVSAEPLPQTVTATPQQRGPATIKVQVPPQAKVWIGQQLTAQTGSDRVFVSPALEPGKNYAYKLKVAWPTANKEDFTVEHEIIVKANQTSAIDFTELAAQPASPVQQAAVRTPVQQPQPQLQPQPTPTPAKRGLLPKSRRTPQPQ